MTDDYFHLLNAFTFLSKEPLKRLSTREMDPFISSLSTEAFQPHGRVKIHCGQSVIMKAAQAIK